MELVEFGTHREGCEVVAGVITPAWWVGPHVTLLDDGRTSILLRCNDARCEAALAVPMRSILDLLEAELKLEGTELPEERET